MSSKKDKLIESATKFIVKGQIDKAIKDYEQVVALDPNDLRNRQKLAELLVRVNRKQEAIDEFDKIGKYYANNAYYLKAIAVYKQIQKLDPANTSITVMLAELNIKQGLEGNALAESNAAFSALERAGDTVGIDKLMEMMLTAYPENPTLRLKAAEYHLKVNRSDESYLEFVELALILQRKKNEVALQQVLEKLRQHFPHKNSLFTDMGEVLLSKGDAGNALKWFRKALEQEPHNSVAWSQYLAALERDGNQAELKQACREMMQQFPADPAPCLQLIRSVIAAGQHDDALMLMNDKRDLFLAAKRSAELEAVYRNLSDTLPGEIKVLQGLRALYLAMGNAAAMLEIDEKILELSGKRTEVTLPSEPVIEAQPEPEPLPEVEPPMEIETTHYEWEEPAGDELDLSSLEDVPSFELESTSLVGSAEQEAVSAEEGSGFAVDWDSEGLDLGDIELVGSPLDGLDSPVVEQLPVESVKKKQQRVRLGEQVDDSDSETHYNLGIAYKEMGLYGEAIKEFQIAAQSPQRKVDCMTLQGLCLREQGDLSAAEESFSRVLSVAAAPAELLCARFELAELYELKGSSSDALRLYREVANTDPEYRDAKKKVVELEGGTKNGYLSDQLLELIMDHDD